MARLTPTLVRHTPQVPIRARRSSETVVDAAAGVGMATGMTATAVAWSAGGAAAVVLSVAAAMMATTRLMRHAKIKRRVTDVDLFVNIGGGYYVPRPTTAFSTAITNAVAQANASVTGASSAPVERRGACEAVDVNGAEEAIEPRPIRVRHM